ncbi:MBL fold metallo-hydrolase [Streptomyces sp. BK340]|uniref:MBL fold metallo-hydrolase n=1 Tax=Streptomyces sp. BK340 TaxID=2572903 RepID=UPI0011AA5580|nr:MBL fold metallo-hydrolase [Streptomyces sp. BK340]TVZ84875.1 glyoxylase-like metal-dependent hydrolase (beta-lactamase superfamily II) [Streptomyces sp. BK340]
MPFLKISAGAAALAAVAALSACSSGGVDATNSSSSLAVHPRMYTFTSDANGFDTQTHFLDTGKSVVAFDAQFTPAYARKALAYLKTKTTHPVKYVVVTHPNPDKFQGLPVFTDAGATSLASDATARAVKSVWTYKKHYFVDIAKTFTSANYPPLPAVQQTFHDRRTLTVDGVRIELTVLKHPGISTTQTIAAIPALHDVVVGDLVHHDAHAWLEGGIANGRPVPTIDGWKDDLDQVQQLTGKDWTVYAGRGPSASVGKAVTQEKSYLSVADHDAANLVKPLDRRERRAAMADPSALVQQLSKELQSQFPTYQFPYMITYGAYGLIDQHLAE